MKRRTEAAQTGVSRLGAAFIGGEGHGRQVGAGKFEFGRFGADSRQIAGGVALCSIEKYGFHIYSVVVILKYSFSV